MIVLYNGYLKPHNWHHLSLQPEKNPNLPQKKPISAPCNETAV